MSFRITLSFVFIASFAFVIQMHRAMPIPLFYFSDKDITHFLRCYFFARLTRQREGNGRYFRTELTKRKILQHQKRSTGEILKKFPTVSANQQSDTNNSIKTDLLPLPPKRNTPTAFTFSGRYDII